MSATSTRTKQLSVLAMLCAIAYVVMLVGRIPVVLFLKYDPKDVIITIGGFMMGPLAAFVISVIVSFIEMLTVSDTGVIGLVMNIISTCAFSCTAAFIYKKQHNLKGAVIGLAAGLVLMTGTMILWNYLITPLYMTNQSRSDIAAMLVPVFLPFNLLKAGLNMALTLLLYKPIVLALRKAHLLQPSSSAPINGGKRKLNIGVILFALALLTTCILLVLVMRGII